MATAQIDLRRHPSGTPYPAPLHQSLERWYKTYEKLGGQDALGAFPHAKRVLDAAISHNMIRLDEIGDRSADPDQESFKTANIIAAHLFRRVGTNRRDFPPEDFGRYSDVVKGFETFDMLRDNDLGMQSSQVYVKLIERRSLGFFARMVDIAQYDRDAGAASEKELATLDPRLFYSFDSQTGKTEYERIALAAKKLYSPLADLFGYRNLAGDLFEIAYLHLDRGIYDQVTSALKRMQNRIGATKSVMGALKSSVAKTLRDEGYCFEMPMRERKHPGKVMEKADRYSRESGRTIGEEVEGLHDLVAFTVILHSHNGKLITQNDIWHFKYVANLIVKEANDLQPLREGLANSDIFEDKITHPKDNGYQSYHVTLTFQKPSFVPIEVIVRDPRMHDFAERGGAAHHLYKGGPEAEAVVRAFNDFMHTLANGTKDPNGVVDSISSRTLRVVMEGQPPRNIVVPVQARIGEAVICAGIPLSNCLVPGSRLSLLDPLQGMDELRLVNNGQVISRAVIDQLLHVAILQPTRETLVEIKKSMKKKRGYLSG